VRSGSGARCSDRAQASLRNVSSAAAARPGPGAVRFNGSRPQTFPSGAVQREPNNALVRSPITVAANRGVIHGAAHCGRYEARRGS